MGHSLGGISALSAVADAPMAKAVVALDPWFYCRNNEVLGAGQAKVGIIFSKSYERDVFFRSDKKCNIEKEIDRY